MSSNLYLGDNRAVIYKLNKPEDRFTAMVYYPTGARKSKLFYTLQEANEWIETVCAMDDPPQPIKHLRH
jgi:hypothetical protein